VNGATLRVGMQRAEIDRKFAETCAERVEASNASWMLRTGEGAAQPCPERRSAIGSRRSPAGRSWRVRLAFAVAAHRRAAKQLVVSGSMRYDHLEAKQAFEIEE
jgi:hypothetical protein